MKFSQTRDKRHSRRGIALIITLIMLAITLVMAVAFLALAKRERGSVSTSTDTTLARLAAETGVANAEGQIVASFLSGFNGVESSNAYNLRLFVSTNYINPQGFNNSLGYVNPTNVSYVYANGAILSPPDFVQNAANLWFLPRAPVMISSNDLVGRFYLDLNQNRRFDANGMQTLISADPAFPYYDLNGNPIASFNPPNVLSNFFVGDPEWVGVLERPDAPHGPNNHFVSRYAFAALPVGNTLDINYIHNQAVSKAVNPTPNGFVADGYFRNQGVGSWELNLAAFLTDLNTNIWGAIALPANLYYAYNEFASNNNTGFAFEDARALLSYRYAYNYNNLFAADFLFNPFLAPNIAANIFPVDGIDAYGDGPLQMSLNGSADPASSVSDGDLHSNFPWVGANNPNHYFSVSDLLDPTKTSANFVSRLSGPGGSNDTYNSYTFYRMLDELGTDSSPEQGKLNLNYSNAVVEYDIQGLVRSVGVISGAETNLVPWTPQNFFNAAADQMLRFYSAYWFKSDPTNFLFTYYGVIPQGYVDATGLGVTNFPNYGVTNEVPAFGLTNIPVYINGKFVYSPAVNRLLQLAANLYDASTNTTVVGGINKNVPHVFRPVLERDNVGNVFIVSYKNISRGSLPNIVSGPGDSQLTLPVTIDYCVNYGASFTPILYPSGTEFVNVYGVPWIIGAKKGLPGFNQLYLNSIVEVTRKLEATRTVSGQVPTVTNQMYVMSVANNMGVSFWNSYSNAYPRPVEIHANDLISMSIANDAGTTIWPTAGPGFVNFSYVQNYPFWEGSQWSGTPPNMTIDNINSFKTNFWTYNFLPTAIYRFASGGFDTSTVGADLWDTTTKPYLQALPQLHLTTTNYFQGYILDGNNVIDYVQLRGPISKRDLTQELADTASDGSGLWNTNLNTGGVAWGLVNQMQISMGAQAAPYISQWKPPTSQYPAGSVKEQADFFRDFMVNPSTQITKPTIQAAYTPSRLVYESVLFQANDPLVHYLVNDLNYVDPGTMGLHRSDDPQNSPVPNPSQNTKSTRYQPWGLSRQMMKLAPADTNAFNLAYKDALVWGSDYWDFPTNAYPSVGWIGRVHRGTPWQTVDLKSTNILTYAQDLGGQGLQNIGSNTWASWTGDTALGVFDQRYDAANFSPTQDRFLFDIFTTRFNDNAARGTLPINQTHLAAWSALFSGMVAITNNQVVVSGGNVNPVYSSMIINPAGVVNGALAYSNLPPVWQIVNGPFGVNVTRANKGVFPLQSFTRVGDILQVPALSEQSPFLNQGSTINKRYGISDEMYEWLPQQMMGLVRLGQPRYVLYCYGQALRPAPNGTVLGGPFFQLVTNYQVVAESAVRAVIRVDDANTAKPHIVVESYNVLPPN